MQSSKFALSGLGLCALCGQYHLIWFSCSVQELMQQVLNCGAAKALPNELQWNLRMLLPRKADALAAGAILESTHPMPAPAPSSSAGTFQDPVITGTAPSQSQAAKVFQEVARPTVTAPAVQAPQYGMPYSEAQPTPQISLGANISQVVLQHSSICDLGRACSPEV